MRHIKLVSLHLSDIGLPVFSYVTHELCTRLIEQLSGILLDARDRYSYFT